MADTLFGLSDARRAGARLPNKPRILRYPKKDRSASISCLDARRPAPSGDRRRGARARADASRATQPSSSARPPTRRAAPSFATALRADERRGDRRGEAPLAVQGLDQRRRSRRRRAGARVRGGGAAAISVLTEPAHFGGSTRRPRRRARRGRASRCSRRTFTSTPIQLLEARALGASAALLIARALSPDALRELVDVGARARARAARRGARRGASSTRALDAGATIIGVNNRNLETLVIDPATAERLIAADSAPTSSPIAESGVSARADVERVAARRRRRGARRFARLGRRRSARPRSRALAGVSRGVGRAR